MQACTNKDHRVQKKICLPDLTLTRKNFVSLEEVFTTPSPEGRAVMGSSEPSSRQNQHFSLKKFLSRMLRSAPWMFLLMYTVFFIILSIFYGFN
ncbi:hypothetical protein A0J51_02577 [Gluconobacter japonicus]|nr:hypothetical protein A0J51_02577 [Gluconobacter japonicus]